MHSAIAISAGPGKQCPHAAPEKVGLRRIRLSLLRHCLRANVGSFFAAEKVLLEWAMHQEGPLACEFEIVYEDGRSLSGEYRFDCWPTRRPALMLFVRRTLKGMCDGAGNLASMRVLGESAHGFLTHYETEDFTSR